MKEAKLPTIDIEPFPKQLRFIESATRYTCFAGGFGCGKTLAGCLRALLLSQLAPGNFGLIGRLTYPELRDTTRKTFFEICPPDWYDIKNGGLWLSSENFLRLYNGSEIIFRHLDTMSEKELLSLNLGWFFIDQAEEISESTFQILVSRLRKVEISRRYGFLACNPIPHNWIYKLFKEKATSDFEIVEATTFENPFLPKDYVKSMLELYPPEMAKRYIYASWEAFEGQVFLEWDSKVHIIDDFEIPDKWEKLIGIDHGLVNPTAVEWAAIDNDGNIFIFDEHYEANQPISHHAKQILEKSEGKEISIVVIDPSTKAKTREKEGFPWSVLEEYNDYGVYPIPGSRDKKARINRLKEFLRVDPERRHPITGEKGSPRLFVFRSCQNLISELPRYQWKKLRSLVPRNPPEEPQDVDDHAIDALGYILMTRWPATVDQPTGFPFIPKEEKRILGSDNEIARPFSESQRPDEILGEFYAE